MNPLELARAVPGPAFTVTLDGRDMEALPGQTVAAALWAAGVTSWRTTRSEGRPTRDLLRHRRVLRLPGHRQRPPQPTGLSGSAPAGGCHQHSGGDGHEH